MAQLGDAVTAVDEVHGFRYFDDRDLLGFVDGTENPRGRGDGGSRDRRRRRPRVRRRQLRDRAEVSPRPRRMERAADRSAGAHHRPTKLSDIELDDSVKPTSAHNALTMITENGQELQILRANMPFGQAGAGEFGTYFIGYCRTPRVTEQMIENMFVGRPPGNYDRLLDFSRAATGTLFFVPSATFLDAVNADAPCAASDGRRRSSPCHRSRRSPTVRSASARSKEKTGMNNLHRELAPISDAAWASIEEETTRTLKRYLAGRRVVDVHGPAGAGSFRGRHRPPEDDRGAGRGHPRTAARGEAAGRIAGALRTRPPADRRRRAGRRGLRLAAGQGRRAGRSPMPRTARSSKAIPAAGIGGIRQGTSNPILTLPADVRLYPTRSPRP